MISPTAKQLEFLARAIVNRLEDRGLVEFGDAERGIEMVIRELGEHFMLAEQLEREARARLGERAPRRTPTDDEVEKEIRRLAEERNLVL